MIVIQPSHTADTRTCDPSQVSKATLLASSEQHIGDVQAALGYFAGELRKAAERHDRDKLTDIDGFHRAFVAGWPEPNEWWENHKRLNRHHLVAMDGTLVDGGIRDDVNLIDVLDYIADGVMAGMGRAGVVRGFQVNDDLLALLGRAFTNTVEQLKAQVVVERPGTYVAQQPVEAVLVADICKSVVRGVLTCPQWLLDRMNAGTLLVTETAVRLEMPDHTEGAAGWNDWIVRFADGTILPVRAEVFTALFGVQSRAEHAP